MEIWKLESNPQKQTAAMVGSLVFGLVIICAAIFFKDSNPKDAMMVLILGLFFFVLGSYGFIFGSKKQITTINPVERSIVVEDFGRFGVKTRRILFDEIADIMIGYLGKKSNHVEFYYLVLKLKSGKEYSLFAPGYFYEGCSDRNVAEGRKERLREYLN